MEKNIRKLAQQVKRKLYKERNLQFSKRYERR